MPEVSPQGAGKFLLAMFIVLILIFSVVLLWIRYEGHKPSLMKNSMLTTDKYVSGFSLTGVYTVFTNTVSGWAAVQSDFS